MLAQVLHEDQIFHTAAAAETTDGMKVFEPFLKP